MNVQDKIKSQLSHDIVLYMKGTAVFPQCGFSSRVVNLLNECFQRMDEMPDVLYVNVLEDDEIREAIKEYGQWPTIPQLYLKGELVGGCDIVSELQESGELLNMLKQAAAKEV
ncbi:MAG: grxD [Gammaproteobacteria bacterium]|jgi:monothiol glutaredoxin|nr:grxD [Gammaproteobacteria bacterium]